MKPILILLCLALTACGSKDESAQNKDLFSLWTHGSTQIDLRGAEFDVKYPIQFAYAPNAGCNCNVQVMGTQTDGIFYITGCVNYGPSNYCTDAGIIYNYTNSNATLNVCNDIDNQCEVYR